jgi:hypothetical protein
LGFRDTLLTMAPKAVAEMPSNDSLPEASRKLKEAKFFLDKFRLSLKPKAFNIHNASHLWLNLRVNAGLKTHLRVDDEEAGYYLSAFMSAARSVTFVLQFEAKDAYDRIFPLWFGRLRRSDQKLLKLMNDERVEEIHRGGVRKIYQEKKIVIRRDVSKDAATIAYPEWYLSRTKKEIVGCSQRYIELLDSLLNEFLESSRSG